jgi:CRISPR-associated endonuclease/helicase Cas3
MAHLLRVASEKKLRHIFVVLPYTNIITQSVEVYRKALVLEGERPEDVVAEHHHRADFGDLELRQLATLWKAPIIVTTAVQFFETLGSHHPARLRKLHELPGSVVFVDEMHAAMPSHLWPQMWRWLEVWTREWGGHLVLASGSLPRFWKLDEYRGLIQSVSSNPIEAPDLVSDDDLKIELAKEEKCRIKYRRRPKGDANALDCEGVISFVLDRPGPRLLIVNTVQTAAVIARAMRKDGNDILHLSTALAPVHRDSIVERIKLRLRDKIGDWTLVATSCVEAGMNFSFRTGFRERASTASLIQVGGRVSRENEHEGAEVWDLLLRDDRFRQNPAMKIPRQALDSFDETILNQQQPAYLATEAMKREWTCGAEEKAKVLIEDEDNMEYRPVSNGGNHRGVGLLCRVIDADTRTVVVDPSLIEAIRQYKRISRTELLRYSVQIWATKINRLGLKLIGRDNELYAWSDDYDPDFLGYMSGVLRNEEFLRDNDAWII